MISQLKNILLNHLGTFKPISDNQKLNKRINRNNLIKFLLIPFVLSVWFSYVNNNVGLQMIFVLFIELVYSVLFYYISIEFTKFYVKENSSKVKKQLYEEVRYSAIFNMLIISISLLFYLLNSIIKDYVSSFVIYFIILQGLITILYMIGKVNLLLNHDLDK